MTSKTALRLPIPKLREGRFALPDSCTQVTSSYIRAYTDEALFAATGVRVAFTTRDGGVSRPPFDSLNLSPFIGDDEACVARNKSLLCAAFGAQENLLIQPKQVHGARIVECSHSAYVPQVAQEALEGADGVVVYCPEVSALLCFADCVPVIIVEPGGCFAVVHAGWRGVDGRIAQQALEMLCARTQALPHECNVYLGPHIRSCHFEVGPEVMNRFVSNFGLGCLADQGHVDLRNALEVQLLEAGALAERICDMGTCTVCDGGEEFFSYRLTQGTCGRHGAFAVRVSSGTVGA